MPDGNTTYIPIQTPTTTVTVTYTGGGGNEILAYNPIFIAVLIGLLILIIGFLLLRRWARKTEKRLIESVDPTLDDLDSATFSLRTYLLVQGGLAIGITIACTLSLLYVIIAPMITVSVCASSIGLTGYGREKAMNMYRETYKNRQNLEGYMRTKKGDKRRYSWSNIKFLNPYTQDEHQYNRLRAYITTINAKRATGEENKETAAQIMKIGKEIDEAHKELDKYMHREPKEGESAEERKSTIDKWLKLIADKENALVMLGDTIPKEIDIDKMIANPILINDKYLVIVCSVGVLKDNVDFVDWFDFDVFGAFDVPTAGPELRELTKFHRVTDDPDDPTYRIDEYVFVFASVFDDRLAREALKPLESIDLETDETLAAMASAMGVERKHTAGEINTSKALAGDLLNEERDFDLLVDTRSDAKALKVIEAERKLKALDKMTEYITPSVLMLIVVFVVGAVLGFLLGQNSVIIG